MDCVFWKNIIVGWIFAKINKIIWEMRENLIFFIGTIFGPKIHRFETPAKKPRLSEQPIKISMGIRICSTVIQLSSNRKIQKREWGFFSIDRLSLSRTFFAWQWIEMKSFGVEYGNFARFRFFLVWLFIVDLEVEFFSGTLRKFPQLPGPGCNLWKLWTQIQTQKLEIEIPDKK